MRVILLVVLSGFAGCGASHKLPVSKITGRVTIDQQPVERGRIVFESPDQRPASGEIRNGEIVEMTTYSPGDGAPLGRHQVAIFAWRESTAGQGASHPSEANKFDARSMSGESLIPARYNNPETAGFVAEVTARGKNHFEFDMKSK